MLDNELFEEFVRFYELNLKMKTIINDIIAKRIKNQINRGKSI